jgi:hypothetical protein
MITRVLIAITATLVLSNAVTAKWAIGLKEDLATAKTQTKNAVDAAKVCSDSVRRMRESAELQAREAAEALAVAQGKVKVAQSLARTELTRPQSVVGDTCESARLETRDWLQSRRAAK